MRARTLVAAVAAAMLLPTAAFSQESVAFPMTREGLDPVSGLQRLSPRAVDVANLRLRDQAILTDFVMPSGERVDLSVERLDLDRLKFGFQVDGQPAPGLLDGLDLSVWMGSVVGSPGSEVVLSFSNSGTSGWVRNGGELAHLMPEPGANGSWNNSYSLLAREEQLTELGMSLGDFCASEQLGRMPEIDASALAAANGGPSGNGGPGGNQYVGGGPDCEFYECGIAIETDFQLYELFNDLGAETAYVTTLLAAASARYEEQINTVLTYPYVQFYTNSSDPWSTPESGGNMLDMLDEFVPAWSGNIPAGAVIGHFVSGAGLGGGVAYLSILCDTAQEFSFAVSGSLNGSTPFPITVGPSNWDFFVFTHETGHNFASPHTQDYNPQIDNCSGGDCITNGTIMSYCHQCPGGTSNITTYFNEPAVVTVMQNHAAACLPFMAPVVPEAGPILIDPDTATLLTANVQGTPVGGVTLNYRFNPGDSFSTTAAADQGGGVWTASLPGTGCGGEPEWFFSMVDATCGAYSTASATAEIGFETILLTDDAEVASGWTTGVGGDDATTGIWERGDPLGTGAQPENDHTAGGSDCYFTGQGTGGSVGENDVDGGTTTLLSPIIDLSSGDARLGYWRWYNNEAGSTPNTDTFVIDISNNGGGSWTTFETVGPNGPGTSGGWIFHEATVSDFVTPTANVQLRFVASDLGEGSIVEAAIDDLTVRRVECSVWEDLGGGTSGVAGVPALEMSGPLTAISLVGLELTNAASSSLSLIFISFTSSRASFLGGTLHAFPFDELVVTGTDGGGGISGSASFPGAASGSQLWFQVATEDLTVPIFSASLSNGVVGTVP